MPNPIVLADEDEALDYLKGILSGDPEVTQWIDDGYTYSVTIVEVDDITPNENAFPSFMPGAEDWWMHDSMIALCQFSSATQLSKRGTLFCWRFGRNGIMSVNFKKEERDLGLYLQRYINRRTAEAEIYSNVVGTPTVSVGVAKASEVSTGISSADTAENLMSLAQNRIRQCKEAGKNQLIGVSESFA